MSPLLHLADATVKVKKNLIRSKVKIFLYLSTSAKFLAEERLQQEVCKEERVAKSVSKTEGPCSDWFMTKGSEGFGKTEGRR